MSTSIRGQTAVVTGAGNGLGRAIAEELSLHGARLILVGRTTDNLTRVASQLHYKARIAPCDVSDPTSVTRFAQEISDERIAILVNNAGIPGPVAALHEIPPADWDDVFAVNVRGVFLITRALLPGMIDRRTGHILSIASVSGKRPLANRTPYTASKMALIGLSTTLAHEVGQYGIAVNTLSPGFVASSRMDRNVRLEAARTGRSPGSVENELTSRTAYKRMVTEQEVAQAAVNILNTPGMTAADLDLSAGIVAR
jgi:NAD(P)-dependent dehydrogenase (short-subunit alcohol dehydrogenase family)